MYVNSLKLKLTSLHFNLIVSFKIDLIQSAGLESQKNILHCRLQYLACIVYNVEYKYF